MIRNSLRLLVIVSATSALLPGTAAFAGPADQSVAASHDSSSPKPAPAQVASPEVPAGPMLGGPTGLLPFQLEGTDLGRMLKRDTQNLVVRGDRRGATMVDLAGGFRNVLVAYTGPDGKQVISCIATEEQARAIFAPAGPNAPKVP